MGKKGKKKDNKRKKKGTDTHADGDNEKKKRSKALQAGSVTPTTTQTQRQPNHTQTSQQGPEGEMDQTQPQTSQRLGETQPEGHRKEAARVEVQAQTEHRATQTEPVSQTTQQTQTDHTEDTQATQPGPRADDKGTERESQHGDKEKEGSMERIEEQSGESSGSSTDPKAGEKLKSYAEVAQAAARKTSESERGSKQPRSQTADQDSKAQGEGSQRILSPISPAGPPMFTFHVYAVLDKKFQFNRDCHTLLLLYNDESIELKITDVMDLDKRGHLIEATFSMEQNSFRRGQWLVYQYGMQQRHKTILEIATRHIQIPFDRDEWHLHEGHITRSESSWSIQGFIGSLIQSKEKNIFEAWEASAHVLLDRVFREWEPSNPKCTQHFTLHLNDYQWSFSTAATGGRVVYPGNFLGPMVKVSELIAAKLVQLLYTESEGKSSKTLTVNNPLLLGFSVFQVCCACNVDLGIKGWAKLCELVSSSTALDKKNVGEMKQVFPASQNLVIALMNSCARKVVSELVLLAPLLHTLRQPGADARRLGPAVEEQSWAGLEGVEYCIFRERLGNLSNQRMMLQLIQKHKSLAKERPHVLTSWLSLMAFKDIPGFVSQAEIPPEHLIQSLMYRLRGFEPNMDNNRAEKNLESTQEILSHLVQRVEEEKDRIMDSEWVDHILQCCISIHKSICRMAQLVPLYKAAVQSFQLVLKVADIQDAALSKDGEEKKNEQIQLSVKLETVQKDFSQWRDALLCHPLLNKFRLSYPKEIEMWNAFFGMESSVQGFSEKWRSGVERDLRKRIAPANNMDKVVVCCRDISMVAIKRSHATIQTCFHDLCQSAIKSICQDGKEGDLLQALSSCTKALPSPVLSSVIVESAARFREDPVAQLLEPQSAIHYLLSQGDWQLWQVDDEAGQVIQNCRSALSSLVEALCQGHIPLGHLKTTLKHREDFKKIYCQYQRNRKEENISIDAEVLLTQRGKDLQAFTQQSAHMDTLIKMMGKVSEFITAQEISNLEVQHRANLQSVSLNELVTVQPYCTKAGDAGTHSGQVLWYKASPLVLVMAREMYEVQASSLLLSSWVAGATDVASMDHGPMPVAMCLAQVYHSIWKPHLVGFSQLGLRIAHGTATFGELDAALEGSGDQGEGEQIKKELNLMAKKLESNHDLEPNWTEVRFCQIQQYRQLHDAAESANAILRIRDVMKLSGDFQKIHSLTQLREDAFKKRTLGSLNDDLIRAQQLLAKVTHQQTRCLEEFLDSQTLVTWVKATLQNLSDLKVFVDLASISAGENDIEIDRVANFHDAVMGYSPLLYSLDTSAGFKEFIYYAQQVWDTLQRDEKLPVKLGDSTRWLDWLKGLKETHGSVEQSSLSLASAINAQGVYHVGWTENHTGKRCLQSLLCVRVRKDNQDKTYSLEELLELQNKLMLMSSKGEHGKEQVNRFTQVFEGVQRMARILLQMHSTGNMLFRECRVLVQCNPERQRCIQVTFSLLEEEVVYQGEATEQLQELCRSMEACHEDWCAFVAEMRSQCHPLNHYTSEQVVYLCQWIYSVCAKEKHVPQQIWNLLAPIKPGCTLNDIRAAFAKATDMTSDPQPLSYIPVARDSEGSSDYDSEPSMDFTSTGRHAKITEMQEPIQEDSEESYAEEPEDEVEEFSDVSEAEEWMEETEVHPSPQIQGEVVEEDVLSVEGLWLRFREDMPRYFTQYMDIGTLARFLSCLSDMNEQHIKRKLPPILQEGKPNLVLCPSTEVLSFALSFYIESPEQALPSSDEVLMCQEDTTEEQVEIFLRRCLGRDAAGSQQKIYTLVNPELLAYDVSVALGERFEALERSAGAHYRLVMVCPVRHQHRYIPSFFSKHKVQAGLCVSAETARKYLRQHFVCDRSHVYPDKLSVWIVSSERPAVGKSLYVRRLFERFQRKFRRAQYLKIRLIESRVNLDAFVQTLSEMLTPLREQDAVLLHIDTAAVHSGLEEFLFNLLVLGCLSDSEGKLWRRNYAHLIAVEVLQPHPTLHSQTQIKETRHGLLHNLPTIHCKPPKEVKTLELSKRNMAVHKSLDPLMDEQEFVSEGIQRPYQFLRRFNRNENLDRFKYQAGSWEGDAVDCLHHLLANCGLKDPSWAELKHFTWFLNLQLKDCENSMFCDPDFLADHLPGFKGFIVKFMILMARDFSSPSMDISDQSPSLLVKGDQEDDLLARLTIRKHWENESHPYIFFNADHMSMSFLGFHVKKDPLRTTLNAVDPRNRKILMGNVMSSELLSGLERQGISLCEDFDHLPREDKIQRISFVVGAKKGWEKGRFDPDPTYELTADNVMKMLAIHMRFRCEIPVIIMGETGCGKTRLVRFLCDLQREGRNVENMKLIKVHGGTTADTIYRKVREAESLAMNNRQSYNLDTILFFDEANTTEAIFAIKEVLCDKTVQGIPLKENTGLKIIAACNPYRRHSSEMVARLECAGLGYRVKAVETEDRLGKVPLRQLVYRVHPLPPSMIPLVWDFGQLSNSAELSYIRQIVQKQIKDHNLPQESQNVISNVLAVSQTYMRSREDECSFVSLRDVERSLRVLVWFYRHCDLLIPNCNQISNVLKTWKCLVLAVGVCYYPSLLCKEQYLLAISSRFPEPFNSQESLEHEISSCQDFFLQNIKTRETIAKNMALKENVFLMVVCIELRIPLFLVGKPGSSKSLAKTVVADAMQRQASHCNLFRNLKEVHMVSFQCSPHSSPEGIIGTFRNCARFQKEKNMDEYVSVVVLDEIGLAEDSPQMPLKTLHPLLEDGCIDNEKPDPHMKVGFVGISNWALDPAKMNRGIFVSRMDPSENELVETANGICSSSKSIVLKIKHLLPKLAKAFLNICRKARNQFFGLRDYYSLVKIIFAIVKDTDQEPSDEELVEAILRNFSGQPEDFDPLLYFEDLFQNFREVPRPSTLRMVKQNLDRHNNKESRYLLLLTTNNAALHIIQQRVFAKGNYASPEIVFGSGFPKDQEYAQICRNVNRVKTCMETGCTVVLLNLQNLYESLYDALNQYYVYLSGQQYVDLGLGSHRVKCRVHKDFRLVVVEDQEKVYTQFPVPLINRLEKHRVNRSTDLTPWQHRVLVKLKEWVQQFSLHSGTESAEFKLSDVFVGFHGDSCASALLQALEKREQQRDRKTRGGHEAQEDDVPVEEAVEENESYGMGTDDDNVKHMILNRSTQPELRRSLDEEVEGNVSMQVIEDEVATGVGEQTGTPSDTEIHDPVEMDVDTDDTEPEDITESCDKGKEEEEIFQMAKSFLLSCATPDSVLRLKDADLGNQEKDRLQTMYFRQQHHRSLRDFMDSHLRKTEDCSRFIEVTTFSSLLTKADVRMVAQSLGLSAERLLMLSLHQFDTEVSFCSKIRAFLRDAGVSLHILLVQMDVEESLCSDELIASGKYCTMNEMISMGSEESNCYIVFITKLSRIASGSQYIGFQGGVWLSVHIDDLKDTEDMSLDLSAFCGTPISKLLCQPTQPEAMKTMDSEIAVPKGQRGDTAHLHCLSLVRSCIQKAVALLRDADTKGSRSMQRMVILLGLLAESPGKTGARFQEVLLRRLVVALEQREELMPSPEEWVNKEAKKRQALQEGGTLRHTLWRCLQSTVTPVLARLLEVLDRDTNLDLLYGTGLSEGLVGFWFDILDDRQILDLALPQNSSGPDQEINVQCHIRVGDVGHPCAAPFSWLIRMYCQSLWEESEFVPGTQQDSTQRVLRFVSSVDSSRLGSYMGKLSEKEGLELGHLYLTDFVLLSFKVQSEKELRVYTGAVLSCVSALQRSTTSVTSDLSPAWILAAARHYAARLDTLCHILQLQPHLAPLVLQKVAQREPTDMREDILALGMCVEETKLQAVASVQECQSFLRRVELLQPCVERAFGQNYSTLCSPGCLQHLDSIKTVWRGMLVVAAFIEQVVTGVESGETRLRELTLKHCNLLQRLMEESPDTKSMDTLQQLIRILNSYHEESISRDLRFGLKCPVCLLELTRPCVLPCEHIFCLSCLQESIQGNRAKSCPKCRVELPANFQPTVSHSIKSALQQHAEVRRCCNSFFLEVVSRFCLSEDQSPHEDVVELLFSLLISAQGEVYKTRELTPFLECVDHSPVVRSVLPKLLLQYSFKQVKCHIQRYLQNLEEHLLDQEDQAELYLLFANCFQDSLHCSAGSGAVEGRELQRHLQDDMAFLSRLARRQTPARRQDPAEFLLCMARLRMCLGTAARLLQRTMGQAQASPGGCEDLERKYLEQVKAVCEYSGNDWYRVFLLRAVNRLAGIDCVQALMNSAPWGWAFPPEVIRLQKLIPAEVDRFLCCGQSYRVLRDRVGQALMESRTDALKASLQDMHHSSTLLSLALFRQVTCRLASTDHIMQPGPQEVKALEDLLRTNTSGDLRDFCTALLSNQIGGPGSPLHVVSGLPAQRRALLELLVHAGSVLHSGNRLLSPLQCIASQPQAMTGAFLPTMPDDHTSDARQWMAGEQRLVEYKCANGHACFVGECGKPGQTSKCAECGVPIGGRNHIPVEGFTQAQGGAGDQTRPGHILGEARRRAEAPDRQLSLVQSCILRLCTHLAMLLGAIRNQQGVSAMIHPRVNDVHAFLWQHLDKDMEVLGRTLDQNLDNTAITVHLVLRASLQYTDAHHQWTGLSSRQEREQWEELVCDSVIKPIIQDLNRRLNQAQEQIRADDRLDGSPLMKLLYMDPRPMLPLPSDCPTHHSSFWKVPETLTVERFTQVTDQSQGGTSAPLVSLFLQKVLCARQLCHLPELAALQADLLRISPTEPQAGAQTIAAVLQQIPAGYQKKMLLGRVKTFTEVWNCLRMEVANSDMGVAPELCEKEVTMESSGGFLSLSRHGPGSCLRVLIDFLSQTHNSLVREARRLNHQEDSDYSVPVEGLSETQLALCHPERELLPLVLANCHYTLRKGLETDTSYDLEAIQSQLNRRFLAGKPLIQADTSKYLNRHQQDFSVVLAEVRSKIPQDQLKGSVRGALRTVLRCFTDVCDAVFAVEIGLRFLGKTGGDAEALLLPYLKDSLKMDKQISSNVAKALGENRLEHATAIWQLLTCWKSELMLRRGQDPFQRLSEEFKGALSEKERRDVKVFLAVTDIDSFSLELHEILLLKTSSRIGDGYSPHWDIRYTLENHLEQKSIPPLPGLDQLPEEITLDKAAEIWRLAVDFKK